MKRFPALAVTAAILASPLVIYALTAGQDRLVRFFPDDAFYYLLTAYHFVQTGMPSFDGLHPTNGFHPLYFLIAAAMATVGSKPALVVLAQLANAVFIFLAAGLAVAHFRLRPGWTAPAVLAMLTLPPVIGFIVLSAGLEASTVWLCTILLLIAFERAMDVHLQSIGRNLWLGVAMTLFMFARLDNLFPLTPFVLLAAGTQARWSGKRAWPRLRALLTVLCVPVLFGSAYLALNFATTGHLMPIHGYVKQTGHFPWSVSWRAATGGGVAGSLIGGLPLAVSAAVLVLSAVGAPSRSGCTRARVCSLVALNLGNILFYLYLLFLASNFYRWYFALPLVCLVIDVVFVLSVWDGLLQWLERLGKGPAVVAVAVLMAVNLAANTAFLVWVGSRPNSTSYQLKKVAELISRYGGSNSVTGTLDAGAVGYYSTGTVINLDGLANSFDFYDRYRRPGRMQEYFQKTRMTHLLVRDMSIENIEDVRSGSYESARCRLDRRIVLRRENELFRHTLPGNFTVYYFVLEKPPEPADAQASLDTRDSI